MPLLLSRSRSQSGAQHTHHYTQTTVTQSISIIYVTVPPDSTSTPTSIIGIKNETDLPSRGVSQSTVVGLSIASVVLAVVVLIGGFLYVRYKRRREDMTLRDLLRDNQLSDASLTRVDHAANLGFGADPSRDRNSSPGALSKHASMQVLAAPGMTEQKGVMVMVPIATNPSVLASYPYSSQLQPSTKFKEADVEAQRFNLNHSAVAGTALSGATAVSLDATLESRKSGTQLSARSLPLLGQLSDGTRLRTGGAEQSDDANGTFLTIPRTIMTSVSDGEDPFAPPRPIELVRSLTVTTAPMTLQHPSQPRQPKTDADTDADPDAIARSSVLRRDGTESLFSHSLLPIPSIVTTRASLDLERMRSASSRTRDIPVNARYLTTSPAYAREDGTYPTLSKPMMPHLETRSLASNEGSVVVSGYDRQSSVSVHSVMQQSAD
eukprot:jgi/Hompol1/3525/HPOL_006587-RA